MKPNIIFGGFRFETAGDAVIAEHALGCLRKAMKAEGVYRPPMLVVLGPPRSGKTTLVNRMLDAVGENAVWYSSEPTTKVLDSAARLRQPYMLLDNLNVSGGWKFLAGWKREDLGENLATFATAETWMCRPPGPPKLEEHPLRCMVLITAMHLELTQDLARRSMVVRLRERE